MHAKLRHLELHEITAAADENSDGKQAVLRERLKLYREGHNMLTLFRKRKPSTTECTVGELKKLIRFSNSSAFPEHNGNTAEVSVCCEQRNEWKRKEQTAYRLRWMPWNSGG